MKPIGAAEILAASESIYEGKILRCAMSTHPCSRLRLLNALDSCDLYTSLSTLHNSVDKSICPDVDCTRYEYEMRNASEIIWIPGKIDLTYSGTKTNSLLTKSLVQTMSSGQSSIALTPSESRRFHRPLGWSQKGDLYDLFSSA